MSQSALKIMTSSREIILVLKPVTKTSMSHKAVSHLGSVKEPLALVISDYQRIKRITGRVTADDKLLSPVDLILDPCAGSFARLVDGILALGDDALKPKLLGDPDQLVRACVKAL